MNSRLQKFFSHFHYYSTFSQYAYIHMYSRWWEWNWINFCIFVLKISSHLTSSYKSRYWKTSDVAPHISSYSFNTFYTNVRFIVYIPLFVKSKTSSYCESRAKVSHFFQHAVIFYHKHLLFLQTSLSLSLMNCVRDEYTNVWFGLLQTPCSLLFLEKLGIECLNWNDLLKWHNDMQR